MHLGVVAATIVLALHVAHGDSCAWGDRVEGRSLRDTPYKAWHVVSLDACKDLCCQDAKCASIDYVAGICRLHTVANCDDDWSGAPSGSPDIVHMDRGKCPFATPRNIAIIVGCSFAVVLTIGAGVFLKVKHSRYVHTAPLVVTSLDQPYRDGNAPETAPSIHAHVVEALDAEAAYSEGEVATESGDEAHEMPSVVDAPEETTAPDAGTVEASPSPPHSTTPPPETGLSMHVSVEVHEPITSGVSAPEETTAPDVGPAQAAPLTPRAGRDESPMPASSRATTPLAPSTHVSVEVSEPVGTLNAEAASSNCEVAIGSDEAHEMASVVDAPEDTTVPQSPPHTGRDESPEPASSLATTPLAQSTHVRVKVSEPVGPVKKTCRSNKPTTTRMPSPHANQSPTSPTSAMATHTAKPNAKQPIPGCNSKKKLAPQPSLQKHTTTAKAPSAKPHATGRTKR